VYRLWVVRLIAVVVLFTPVGWITLAGPSLAAGAGAAAARGPAGGRGSAAGPGAAAAGAIGGTRTPVRIPALGRAPRAGRTPGLAGVRPGAPASLVLPASVPAAAARPAPLVADSASALTGKRGLAAPPMTRYMRRANAAKQAMARKFMAANARKESPGTASQGAASQGAASPGAASPGAASQGAASPGTKCTSLTCRSGLPATQVLKGTQRAQIRNYYCGPAAVSEMLRQMGTKVSQSRAAHELKTNSGGTDWSNSHGYPVPKTLNRNQQRNVYVAVALPWSPTHRQFRRYRRDLVTDVNYHGGVPLAGDAYEVPGGPHLVGHPINQEIFHWFDIRGYENSGNTTEYEDSVHGASSIGWAADVPAYSALSSRTIVMILGARGYDW
jgi:hypothetical protein